MLSSVVLRRVLRNDGLVQSRYELHHVQSCHNGERSWLAASFDTVFFDLYGLGGSMLFFIVGGCIWSWELCWGFVDDGDRVRG